MTTRETVENSLRQKCATKFHKDIGYVLSIWIVDDTGLSFRTVNYHLNKSKKAIKVRPNPGGYGLWWWKED